MRLHVLLATCLLTAACGSDSSGPGDQGDLVCTGVSFALTAGVPLDEIAVGRLPANFEEPFAAQIIGGDGSASGHALVRAAESGDVFVTVPLHPTSPLTGGTVQLVLTDGTRECAPVSFAVQALPAADGELAAIADALRDVFRSQAALFGTTPEALAATDPATLPPVYHPLLTVQNALENPDNEYSLISILDGSSPWSDPAAVALAERLLARTGLRASLESAAAASAAARVDSPSRVDDPGTECTAAYVGSDAARLDACMELASSIAAGLSGASGEVLADLQQAFAVVGLIPIPQVEVAAAVVGTCAYILEIQRKRMTGLLPSFLADMSVDFGRTQFLEDEVGPGSWSNAEVLATSEGWDMGRNVIQSALTAAGFIRTFEKFIGAEALDDFVVYLVSQWVIPALLDGGTLEDFQIEAETFGPVDVTGAEWSESRVATGDAVEFITHTIYDLKRTGTATISVRTEDGEFGGQQIAESAEITIGQLDIDIEPAEAVVEPGEVYFFTVTVTDAAFPEAVALVEGLTLQGNAEIVFDGGGTSTHTLTYTAPATPDASQPDVLSVYHTTTQGARGFGATPRTASATVRFGGVQITTTPRCVDPGGDPLQIEVQVAGGIENPELIWTTSAGQISDSGVFTPPSQAQIVTITVALAENPSIEDSLEIQVGGCSCSATISVGGEVAATTFLRFFLTPDLTGVQSFDWRGGTDESPSQVTFGFGGDPVSPITVPLPNVGGFDAYGSGIINGRVFMNPDDFDEPTLSPLNLSLSENTGSRFVGSVTGTVSMAADPEFVDVPLFLTFAIEADPFLSTSDVKMCEVVQ